MSRSKKSQDIKEEGNIKDDVLPEADQSSDELSQDQQTPKENKPSKLPVPKGGMKMSEEKSSGEDVLKILQRLQESINLLETKFEETDHSRKPRERDDRRKSDWQRVYGDELEPNREKLAKKFEQEVKGSYDLNQVTITAPIVTLYYSIEGYAQCLIIYCNYLTVQY